MIEIPWWDGPEPTYPLTQSPAAWQATLPKLDLVAKPAVERLLAEAEPDERGLVTLQLTERLMMQVAPAADDALWDKLEDDGVLDD